MSDPTEHRAKAVSIVDRVYGEGAYELAMNTPARDATPDRMRPAWLVDRIARAITEAVEGERERCAKVANARGVIEQEAFGLDRSAQNCYRIRDAIRRGDA